MARISIATTANCHDYKAKPTTPMVANAAESNGEENEDGGGRQEGLYLRAYGPVTRSAFISHKFDMICTEYDNGYQPREIAEQLPPTAS